MKNDKLIDYKETIFVKIFKFFNLILPQKRNIVDIENMKEKSITKEKDSISFFENIKIKENEEEIRLKRLTALNPVIGYKNSTKIAKEAMATGKSVYDLVLEHGILNKEELDTILSPENMLHPVKLDIQARR